MATLETIRLTEKKKKNISINNPWNKFFFLIEKHFIVVVLKEKTRSREDEITDSSTNLPLCVCWALDNCTRGEELQSIEDIFLFFFLLFPDFFGSPKIKKKVKRDKTKLGSCVLPPHLLLPLKEAESSMQSMTNLIFQKKISRRRCTPAKAFPWPILT